MATLEQLTRPLTSKQVEDQLYAAMVARGITTSSWKPGAVTRTIISALAIVLAAFSVLSAHIASSGFLERSSGAWLDLVAKHVYGTVRIDESFATGFVRLTNTEGVGSFIGVQPGDLVVKNAAGKTYRSTSVFSLPAVIGAYVDVPVQADEAGSASSTEADSITELVTTFPGCDVTNPAGLVGSDREDDEQLKARARAKTGTLSPNGPKDAYSYVAKSAQRADGTSIGVTRVRSIPDGVGGIDIYVADADGAVTGIVGDETTDLGIIDRDIQENAAPLAITARLHSATPRIVPVQYELWVDSTIGLSASALDERITAEISAYLSIVPIGGEVIPGLAGGHLFASAIEAAITRAVGREHLIRCVLSAPSTLPLGETEAPLAGTVTSTIHLVSSTGVM